MRVENADGLFTQPPSLSMHHIIVLSASVRTTLLQYKLTLSRRDWLFHASMPYGSSSGKEALMLQLLLNYDNLFMLSLLLDLAPLNLLCTMRSRPRGMNHS